MKGKGLGERRDREKDREGRKRDKGLGIRVGNRGEREGGEELM